MCEAEDPVLFSYEGPADNSLAQHSLGEQVCYHLTVRKASIKEPTQVISVSQRPDDGEHQHPDLGNIIHVNG